MLPRRQKAAQMQSCTCIDGFFFGIQDSRMRAKSIYIAIFDVQQVRNNIVAGAILHHTKKVSFMANAIKKVLIYKTALFKVMTACYWQRYWNQWTNDTCIPVALSGKFNCCARLLLEASSEYISHVVRKYEPSIICGPPYWNPLFLRSRALCSGL